MSEELGGGGGGKEALSKIVYAKLEFEVDIYRAVGTIGEKSSLQIFY